MTHKERILATLRGEPMDYIPWVPRWELWYEAALRDGRLPEKYRGWSFFDVTRDLGMGIKGNQGQIYKSELKRVEVRVRKRGGETLTEYITPVGAVSTRHLLTPELEAQGVQGREIEHLIKTKEDYGPVLFMLENTKIRPTYQEFLRYEEEIGEDGIAMAVTGSCPAHCIMREYTGYQNFYYELHDHPREIEELLQALTAQGEEIQRLAAESPALIVRHDGNYDAQLTPPPIYQKYFLPFHRSFAEKLHAKGKFFCTHTDGHNDGLMGLILESGFDIAEAFTPPPMTNIGIAEAREVWGDKITIWGGIASTMLSERVPDEAFEEHMRTIFREAAPGDHFILGTGDNVPTDATLERVERITEMVEIWGKYPLRAL